MFVILGRDAVTVAVVTLLLFPNPTSAYLQAYQTAGSWSTGAPDTPGRGGNGYDRGYRRAIGSRAIGSRSRSRDVIRRTVNGKTSGDSPSGRKSSRAVRPSNGGSCLPTNPNQSISKDDTKEALQNVVVQLQGQLRRGEDHQSSERGEIDDIFADLRELPVLKPGVETANLGQAQSDGDVPSNIRSGRAENVTRVKDKAGYINGRESVDDLESLSATLARLQEIAEARDMEATSERPSAWEPPLMVIRAKHKEILSRFAQLRKGRIVWEVLPLLHRAKEAGIPLSKSVYNGALLTFTQVPGRYMHALQVLDLMRQDSGAGTDPDLISYNTALRVCGHSGKWRVSLELISQMQENGIRPTNDSYNSVLHGMAQCREWYRAKRLAQKMQSMGISLNPFSYNALVEAAGMGSLSPRWTMLQIMQRMESEGQEPNAYTYTLLVQCLVKRRKGLDAYQARQAGLPMVMARLVDARVPMLLRGLKTSLWLCQKHRDWRRAMFILEEIRKGGDKLTG
ncbi:unnamed protein product [Discosporangium mesarthrocarpum]